LIFFAFSHSGRGPRENSWGEQLGIQCPLFRLPEAGIRDVLGSVGDHQLGGRPLTAGARVKPSTGDPAFQT
jgi:hypothetical protein